MPESFTIVAKAINEALASDSANKKYLSSLGKIGLLLEIEAPDTSILLEVEEGEVSLYKASDSEEHDLRIQGKAVRLLKLLVQPIENAAQLRDSGISVQGDAALLLELSQVSKNIEIDWVALLAERIGETPAVILGKGFAEAKLASKTIINTQKETLENWIADNPSLIPTRAEFDQLKHRLREANYRLDRIEAVLKQRSSRAVQN